MAKKTQMTKVNVNNEHTNQGGGTKLYKHTFYDSTYENTYELITTYSEPFDFTTLDTYRKIYYFLETINVISFTKYGNPMIFDENDDYFCVINVYAGEIEISTQDDWLLSNTTDTIIEL